MKYPECGKDVTTPIKEWDLIPKVNIKMYECFGKKFRVRKDWSKLETSVLGVFLLKLPAYRSAPTSSAVELSPADDVGRPKKRWGLVLRTSDELEEFKDPFHYEKLSKLLWMLDQINPKVEVAKPKKGEEVIEL